ncbi:MAG TPA: MarP family serine protease, partial [Candidatus Limnocylindrales bacterium]|nr:MarP family serine protease [Candidatus Limnocylindrales bacterium]
LLQPYTTTLADAQLDRAVIALVTVLGSAFALLAIGEFLGIRLKGKFLNNPFNKVDGWLGSVVGVGTLLIAVWLGSAIVSTMPLPSTREQIRESRILSGLNSNLPSTTAVISNLSSLIEPNNFPQVFTGREPALPANTTVPGIGADVQQAIDRSKASIVKFEGLGCGGVVQGTGFVIDSDLIITNAHVIAGVNQPYVRDANGQHTATPVWFDPELDFAIVRADNLAGGPLLIARDLVDPGTRGAVIGYPGGGALTAGGASVLDRFTARGRDIYNRRVSDRDVYSLAARVIPGNSGGPVIAADGTVIGVIFAQSTTHQNVGYALTMPQLAGAINQAQIQNRAVSTGPCARE